MSGHGTYDHHQTSSSSTWTIVHNLGVNSIATDAFIDISGTLTKVLPLTVTQTDSNTLTVTFSSAQIGWCRVIG